MGAPNDGSAWIDAGEPDYRVLCGGAWDNNPAALRAAKRYKALTGGRDNDISFRVARTLSP
jgi:formylglycine-generating enzyme required for sulfatase activity